MFDYAYKSEELEATAYGKGDFVKVSEQHTEYNVEIGGRADYTTTVGTNGTLNAHVEASHHIDQDQSTTKGAGHINYDYKTKNVTGNARVEGDAIKMTGSDLDYNIGISGTLQTVKAYGDNENLKTDFGASYKIAPNQSTAKINGEISYEYILNDSKTSAYINGSVTKLSNQNLDYNIGIGGSLQTIKAYGDNENLKTDFSIEYALTKNNSDIKILSNVSYQNNNWESKLSGEYGNNLQSATFNIGYKEANATEFNLYLRYENQRNQFYNQWNKNKEIGINFQFKF